MQRSLLRASIPVRSKDKPLFPGWRSVETLGEIYWPRSNDRHGRLRRLATSILRPAASASGHASPEASPWHEALPRYEMSQKHTSSQQSHSLTPPSAVFVSATRLRWQSKK